MLIHQNAENLNLDPETAEKMEWHNWAWNSHKWVEISKGYYQCSFCNARWTSVMPIGDNVRLCLHNPILKRLQIIDNGQI